MVTFRLTKRISELFVSAYVCFCDFEKFICDTFIM